MAEEFEKLIDCLIEIFGKNRITTKRKKIIKKCVEDFGMKTVLECLDIAISKYYDNQIPETLSDVFRHLSGICFYESTPFNESIFRRNYLLKIIKNKREYEWEDNFYYSIREIRKIINEFDLNDVDNFELLKEIIKDSRDCEEVLQKVTEAKTWEYTE